MHIQESFLFVVWGHSLCFLWHNCGSLLHFINYSKFKVDTLRQREQTGKKHIVPKYHRMVPNSQNTPSECSPSISDRRAADKQYLKIAKKTRQDCTQQISTVCHFYSTGVLTNFVKKKHSFLIQKRGWINTFYKGRLFHDLTRRLQRKNFK